MVKIKPFDYSKIDKKIEKKKIVEQAEPIADQEVVFKYLKGEKGDKPSKEELLEIIKPLIPDKTTEEELVMIIKPLIPDPIPGKSPTNKELTILIKSLVKNGETPSDEKLLSLIAPLISEKEIILDTPEEVRDKIESLKKGNKLSIQSIEDLAGIIDDLYKKLDEKSKISNEKSMYGGNTKGSIYGGQPNQSRFVDDETPSGTIDGTNTAFHILRVPSKGSLKVYRGGARQRINEDYTLDGTKITFIIPPQIGDILLCDYRR